eukprot:TRINITY_DN6001_c0_g4_i1.p1 TRINITY_DN6001_c0_g4~~TRINITY_DN6001_c0_g4_i1.p1  ORF type:complete len:478 (-),score=64.01 TRINITY_DN6001_c0_g4_i1:35-1468(-)
MKPNALQREASFHEIDYVLTVESTERTLEISAEEKLTGCIWKDSFTSASIEDVTREAGAFKKFSVFVGMIHSGLNRESSAVAVDLATSYDLETPKSHHYRSSSMADRKIVSEKDERYFVLTHTETSESVQYLLPLYFDEYPEAETLKNTINRLAKELTLFKSNPLVEAIKENEMLKRCINVLEANKFGRAVDIYSFIQKEKNYMRVIVQENKLAEARQELANTNEKIYRIKNELKFTNDSSKIPELESLREELAELASRLEAERREKRKLIEKNGNRIAKIIRELTEYIEDEKILQIQLRKLREQSRSKHLYRLAYAPKRKIKNTPHRRTTPKRSYSVPSSRRSSTRNSYSGNNRLHSPGGVPRPHSRAKANRVMGAVDRACTEAKLVNLKGKPPLSAKPSIVTPRQGKVRLVESRTERKELEMPKLSKADAILAEYEMKSARNQKKKLIDVKYKEVKVSDIDDRLARLRILLNSVK